MTNQKDDKLRKLLQGVELNKPGSSFTEGVMKEIQSEVVFNPLLKSMLKNTSIEGPSENFTYDIMGQLEVSDFKLADQSIISKKVWLIASVLVVLLVMIALSGQQENNPSISPYFNGFRNSLHPILTYLNSIPSITLICLISVSGLLLLDYFLKEKILRFTKL
jgi:hypothetical protein